MSIVVTPSPRQRKTLLGNAVVTQRELSLQAIEVEVLGTLEYVIPVILHSTWSARAAVSTQPSNVTHSAQSESADAQASVLRDGRHTSKWLV